jgi:hypothetical protein
MKHDTRELLLAIIVFLIVIILIKSIKKSDDATQASRSADVIQAPIEQPLTTVEQAIAGTGADPTHLPIYDTSGAANFTTVPRDITQYLKPLETAPVVDAKADVQTGPLSINEKSVLSQEYTKKLMQESLLFDTSPEGTTQNRDISIIKSIPISKDCVDSQPSLCEKWKNNNECIINPEYMLYHCPSACGACAMNDGQKALLVSIYNQRDPINCVSHGEYKLPDI